VFRLTYNQGEKVVTQWLYNPAYATKTVQFRLMDLRLGATKGVTFFTYPAVVMSTSTASLTLPSYMPSGTFSIATIIDGNYFTSPVIYVVGDPNYRPPFSGPAISINYPDKLV
jgi:hypothetical protein